MSTNPEIFDPGAGPRRPSLPEVHGSVPVLAGLALGIAGVVLVAYRGGTDTDAGFYVAVAA